MSFLRLTPFAVAVLVVCSSITGTAHAQRKICTPQGCWIVPTVPAPVAPATIRPANTLPRPAVQVWIDLDATPQETIFSTANGVVIWEGEAETLIVTNAHVITQAEQVRIGTAPAEIVFSDAITDLAILRVEGKLPNTGVAQIRATELGIGEPCWYYGYLPPAWKLGYLQGRRMRRDQVRWLTISLVAKQGMSGGGVYDDAGQLVGILSRGNGTDTQVVPVSMVVELVNRYRQTQQPGQLTDVERRQKELFDALQAQRAEIERMKQPAKKIIPDDRSDPIEHAPGAITAPGAIGEVVKVPADPGMPPVEQPAQSAPGGTLWGRIGAAGKLIAKGLTYTEVAAGVGVPAALLLAGLSYIKSRRTRVETKIEPRPVVVENPPPPQVIDRSLKFQPYETDLTAEAFEWASREYGTKYPGSISMIHTLRSMMDQFISGRRATGGK